MLRKNVKRRSLRANYPAYSDVQLVCAPEMEEAAHRYTPTKLQPKRSPRLEESPKARSNGTALDFDGALPPPSSPYAFRPVDFFIAVLVGLIAFAVYFRTLGPTITGEDSGELVTAAYTLGVAHPPGYPLWCLLGKLFTLIPIGTVAWRVNLMSAVFATLAVNLTFLLALRILRNKVAASTSALAFAFSAKFWSQSVIAEVYSLNAALVVGCLLLLLMWYERRHARYLASFAFVYGLGLTNHNTMHLLGPLFLLAIFYVDREPWKRTRLYVTCFLVSLLPLSLYLYLPIRAAADPPVNWGNPDTIQAFWDVVSRKQYSFGFTKNSRSLGRFLVDLWAFVKLCAGEFTPWLCWVPVVGVAALWRNYRIAAQALLGTFFYLVVGFIVLLNFDVDMESLWLNNVFWIPAYMIAAVFIGAALTLVTELLRGRVVARYLTAILGGVCVSIPLLFNFHENDKSNYYFAYDYGVNSLRTLEKDAIYFPSADHATFPVIYLQAVEGMRPDVAIANKYGYPEENLYADMPEEQRKSYRNIPNDKQEEEIEDWIVSHTDRPVYFTKKRSFPNLPGRQLVDDGLLYRVTKSEELRAPRDWWAEYEWRELDPAQTRGDLTAKFVLSDFRYLRARDQLAAGDKLNGLQNLRLSLAISGDNKESFNNAGSLCAESGLMEEAMEFYAQTLKLDPQYDLALRNLGKVYLQKEQYSQAMPLFERLLKKLPADSEGILLLTKCLTQMGRGGEALDRLQFLAQVFPDDPRAFREMGFIYLNELGDQQTAQRMFAQSLTLDPNQLDLANLTLNPGGQQDALAFDPMSELLPKLPIVPGVESRTPRQQPTTAQVP